MATYYVVWKCLREFFLQILANFMSMPSKFKVLTNKESL